MNFNNSYGIIHLLASIMGRLGPDGHSLYINQCTAVNLVWFMHQLKNVVFLKGRNGRAKTNRTKGSNGGDLPAEPTAPNHTVVVVWRSQQKAPTDS